MNPYIKVMKANLIILGAMAVAGFIIETIEKFKDS